MDIKDACDNEKMNPKIG